MGLGTLLRNLVYTGVDTATGATDTYTVITDGGPGMYADWSRGQYQGGMTIPGASRAALLLADLLGQVPWHAFRDGPGGVAVRVAPNLALLEQPAPPDTRMTTFSSWGLDLIWHGNAVGLVATRDGFGAPTSVLPVPARLVGVDRVGPRTPSELPVGSLRYQIGNSHYAAVDVIHIKGPCEPGALRGAGVLENHLATTLGLAVEQTRQAANLPRSGVPTGVLKSLNPDLTLAEAAALKASWLAATRDRSVAVLNPATSFEALAWNPTETQLLEARKYSLHEIALVFGLDPSWLGVAQSSRVYSNITEDTANLLKFSLGGHLARFEQALTAALPDPGEWVKANLDALLRATTKPRYEAHEIALRAGFLLPSEVRATEDLVAAPELDQRWLAAPPPPDRSR